MVKYEAICNATSGGDTNGTKHGHGRSSYGDNVGPTRTCTYKYFMNRRPKNIYGNEGVIGLTW